MILTVVQVSGDVLEVPLEEGRSGATLVVDGFPQVLELRGCTGIELTGGSHPVLTLIWGQVRRPFGCWPESVLAVGWEDPAAAVHTNPQRSRSFTIDDILSIDVDPSRLTVSETQEVSS